MMQGILKPILSVAAIGIFLWIAIASFGSSNTMVQVGECKPKPSFTGRLHIEVILRHQGGTGIPNAAGTLFLVHQNIQDTSTCSHIVESSVTIPFTTNIEGSFNYTTQEFTHDNEGDLWRVEVLIPPKRGSYEGGRRLDAARYSTTDLEIRYTEYPTL